MSGTHPLRVIPAFAGMTEVLHIASKLRGPLRFLFPFAVKDWVFGKRNTFQRECHANNRG